MTCSTPGQSPDWKAYALGEISPADREAAESHASTCEACREELAVLRLTLDSLSTLPEVEIPRRIAFVSDPVFEQPATVSTAAPFWQRFSQMFVTPTFAAASVLAVAILAHGAMNPGGAGEAQIQARVDAAVTEAVADKVQQIEDMQEYMATEVQKAAGRIERSPNADAGLGSLLVQESLVNKLMTGWRLPHMNRMNWNLKWIPAVGMALLMTVAAQAIGGGRIERIALATGEARLENAVKSAATGSTMQIIGAPRGVYIEGVGVVLTAEVNLATAQISLMHPALNDKEKAELHQQKLLMLPQLKDALREALLIAPNDFPGLGPNEKIMIALILPRYSWENAQGLPMQITVQSTIQDLKTGGQQIQVSEL